MNRTINKINPVLFLVRVLDAKLGNVKTRFLDMPVVNIGTAENLFSAIKESLSNTIWILVKQSPLCQTLQMS